MSITIRPAQPQDVALAVPLIYSSGPTAFEYVFGHAQKGNAQTFLRGAFVDGRGEFGYKNHLIVEQGDQIVGAGAGYGSDVSFPFTLAAIAQIIRFYGMAAGGTIVRGLRTEAVVPPPHTKSMYYIAHLGVSPTMRGMGIGSQLIDYLVENGRALGKKTAELDVSVENPRAQDLYERLGFKVIKERASSLQNRFGHVAAHRRMSLPL